MRLVSLLSTAAFTLACGVQAPSTQVDTYEAYLKTSSQLTCEASLRCCGTVCKDDTDTSFYQASARTLDYLGKGLLSYDSQAAMDCLAGLSQRFTDCDATVFDRPVPPVCDKVLIPKSPAGGICETGIAACVPDTVCIKGSCVSLPQLGQGCQPNVFNCVSGLSCSQQNFTCVNPLKAGQTCNGVVPCATGLYCSPGQGLGTCAPYQQSGQACNPIKPCDPTANLVCLPPGNCQPLPVPQTVRQQLCALR